MSVPAPIPGFVPHFGDFTAWLQSTYYALGQRVTANAKVYQATVSGVSSGAGTGPSGNGGAIADNTVTWAYQVDLSAAWVALTAYALGGVVTNDGGKFYECIKAGTSAAAVGPTGTTGVITDGTVTWSYTSTAVAQITAPTTRVGDIGQIPGSPFSAPYDNWWKSSVVKWLYYLRDFLAGANTWTGVQTFNTKATFVSGATFDTGGGLSIFGDASDGTHTLDGAATIVGMAPVANVYTAVRDLFFDSLTINNGIVLFMSGFRLYVNGTLTMLGTATIHCNGTSASGGPPQTTIGLGGGHSGILAASVACDGGVAGNPNAGGDRLLINALGVAGGDGGNGGGGDGGDSTVTAPVATVGSVRVPPSALTGFLMGLSGPIVVQGGSGGGGGAGDGAALPGGAGGGGGGVLIIIARLIALANTARLDVTGGAGGTSNGAGCAGGGGGGAGATVFGYHALVSGSLPSAITSFAGGAAGTGGAGGNPGTIGGSGSNANNLYLFTV